jgi:RNA polymerase sigma-70 factor (ECF subfamily)
MEPRPLPSLATDAVAPLDAGGGAGPSRATRMESARERELVARAGTDAAAFGELYDFYLPRIYGFVHRRTRERAVTEDLTATTFERALAALRGGRFRNEAFGGWLYRVAGNAVIDHVRAARRIAPGAEADGDAADPAPDALVAAIDHDALRRAMDDLSDTHRRVLALRFYDDLDPEEAAAVLGCSRRTFAVKLHRALAALRAAMAPESLDQLEATDVA